MIDYSDADPERPLLPEVEVQLSGHPGHALSIVSRVTRAMRRAGYEEEADVFYRDALSGDYDHLLATCRRWVAIS